MQSACTQAGGPDVLRWEEVAVGNPGPGQARLRHVAVGLNFADTYFRTGFYPVPLPNGIGVEAAGIVEAVGEGVTNVAPGDRVTYTGFLNTLGAYSTERVIPAAPLIKLPPPISCETAAAMTMRGLTSAYLMRRIWPLQAGDTILLHAAAGGVGLIVSQWAKLLGLTVIGTVSSEAKAAVARAHGCDHVIDYAPRGRRETRARDHRRRRRDRRLRQRRQGAPSRHRSIRSSGAVCSCASGRPRARSRRSTRRNLRSRAPCSSRGRRSPTTSPIRRRRARSPDELFDHVAAGRIRIEINQRYRAARMRSQAHRDLEARKTTGSSIFVI